MKTQNLKKIKECNTESKANDLLNNGWILIDVKIEKIRIKTGTEFIGHDLVSKKYEVVYEDKLVVIYILGEN